MGLSTVNIPRAVSPIGGPDRRFKNVVTYNLNLSIYLLYNGNVRVLSMELQQVINHRYYNSKMIP